MQQKNKTSKFWYRLGYSFFHLFLLFFYSLRYFHRQRVPASGPLLIVANHESFWDPPIVGCAIGRQVTYMARKTLFDHKLLAWLMHRVGAFPVDQKGTGLEGLRTALHKLSEGKGVIIFPEGSRTRDGKMHDFMPGIALLIRRSGAAVLPVGLAGAYDGWPIHSKKPKFAPLWAGARKQAIACVIGQVVPPETLATMDTKPMLHYIQERVAEVRAEAYRRKRLPTPVL
jgi:1-acyl-sn-glycerol-3-phosphate acyltransferase